MINGGVIFSDLLNNWYIWNIL